MTVSADVASSLSSSHNASYAVNAAVSTAVCICSSLIWLRLACGLPSEVAVHGDDQQTDT